MSSHFSKEFYEKWNHLLSDIDMETVPLQFIEKITVKLDNDETVIFDIATLIQKKVSVKKIEKQLLKFLDKHFEAHDGVDFHVNILAVADTVTKKVSKILGHD